MNHGVRGRLVGVVMAISLGFAPVGQAQTQDPSVAVKALVEQIRAYGPEGKSAAPEQAQVAKKLTRLLDLEGLSQRALGDEWARLPPKERERFQTLIRELFEEVAYPSAAEFFGDLNLEVQKTRDDVFALAPPGAQIVSTELSHPDEGLVEIDFAVYRAEDGWRIADVVLDGVSLGLDIRTQMQKILREDGYEELKRRLREKIEEEGA